MANNRDNQHHPAGLAAPPPEADLATQSLADALRVSFRLLTGIMILVVIGFLLTGLKVIPPQEIGIKKVLGKVVGSAEPGLAYTWPFPVGEIQIVPIKEKTIVIDRFWLHETKEDKTLDFNKRRAPSQGLRPGTDGSLFTGDRNLLHVELTCQYKIPNSEAAKAFTRLGGVVRDVGKADEPGYGFVVNPDELVRSQVCRAVVKVASARTADDIKRAGKESFAAAVLKEAQDSLNDLTRVDGKPYEAIRISTISVQRNTWPIRALRAYEQAQKAISERNETRNQAIGDARKILNEAAGANYGILVGSPEEFAAAGPETGKDTSEGTGVGLVGEYFAAKDSDPDRADGILKQIEQVLMSSSTGGEAAAMINEAKTYRTQVIQAAESRAKRFEELLAEYENNPQFWLERRWADTRDAILSSPTIEKYYVTPGERETVLIIGPDPEVRKEIERELRKKDEDRGTLRK